MAPHRNHQDAPRWLDRVEAQAVLNELATHITTLTRRVVAGQDIDVAELMAVHAEMVALQIAWGELLP
jgi:hypothetical protein